MKIAKKKDKIAFAQCMRAEIALSIHYPEGTSETDPAPMLLCPLCHRKYNKGGSVIDVFLKNPCPLGNILFQFKF
jgi:hypothetical protein